MIIVVHSDYLGYILIRHLNHNARFTMDFLFVQFHSTIKSFILLIKLKLFIRLLITISYLRSII